MVATPCNATGATLLGGLLCQHNLVCRPKAGFLVRRADVTRLLEISAAKAQCYTELWRERRAIPRLRSGLPDDRLLCVSDVCSCSCNGDGVPEHAAPAAGTTASGRLLSVRRRFASGHTRKQGCISVPEAEGANGPLQLSCSTVKSACRDAFRFTVSRLFVRGPDGMDVEMAADEILGSKVDVVYIEKDESATPAEHEGAAFDRSVFRMAPPQAFAGSGEPAARS